MLAGCSPDASSGDPAGPILLQNENNYRATGSLTLPTVETAPGADLDICWNEVSTDMQCHPVVPREDLDNVGFLRFLHLGEAEVEAKLTSGELKQSNIDGYVDFPTDHTSTCTKLSKFSFFGTAIDVAKEYQENPDETYLLLFTHGKTPGLGARVMTFVKPTATSTNTRVNAPSGCGQLKFEADLASSAKVSVSSVGPWKVDWRHVTVNGEGNEFDYVTIDQLLVGFYQNKSVTELQSRFFDIEILATSLWDLQLETLGTADLSQAHNRATGVTFDGFSHGNGTWILGLFCSTCQNPAPVVLVVLEPKGVK